MLPLSLQFMPHFTTICPGQLPASVIGNSKVRTRPNAAQEQHVSPALADLFPPAIHAAELTRGLLSDLAF